MNIACGVDLVYLPRFKKSLKRGGENFLRRIYHEQELIKNDTAHLAGIFAAKAQRFSAQNEAHNWSATSESSKNFIENKGQFKLPAPCEMNSSVRFAYDDGSTKILFTPKGFVYYFSEMKKPK